MVNGNYVLYGDRPSSESEIVDDHVHARTIDRKAKRKANRTANELQQSLNQAQLDNETDSVKYEKKTKEPRLLRYVPTTEIEENFITEKFETYDLKPAEERPRRYAFTKKPRNPTDGSINYAYSRSSSSCSSPNGNLPTISEHGEQYGTYRVQSIPGVNNIMSSYENKLDKYFAKPREFKKFAVKGSHPDSLYRVPASSGSGGGKMSRVLRILRWPVALIVVCIALALFVYFLVPNNYVTDLDTDNGTYWEPTAAGVNLQTYQETSSKNVSTPSKNKTEKISPQIKGTKPSEIDFYDTDKSVDSTSDLDTVTENSKKRILPVVPVFPSHITPEVQYGNEKVDKLRTPRLFEDVDVLPEDSTLKPHITQKPEKPLEIYFKDTTGMSTETIARSESVNEFTSFEEKYSTKKATEFPIKANPLFHKDQAVPEFKQNQNINKQNVNVRPELPPEIQEFYGRPASNAEVKFTSGHSKIFGISIEDAEKMKSTTQSSLYNTKVSPTLPTWRDVDTTTKNYQSNIQLEVPQCHSTRLALCRGVLPYDLAGTAASIGGVEVTNLMSQIEYLVATNCSDRVRHFFCALLEPECSPPPYPPKMPCYNLCKAIVDHCDGLIPRELTPAFKCHHYTRNNCVAAKTPCYPRELTCGDGSCVPRDWICDGTQDCPGGEDEASCETCDKREFRCESGGCILNSWVCDGYADCTNGEDEDEYICGAADGNIAGGDRQSEPGEESAGSAPAPAVRRPNRGPSSLKLTGEHDSSKELLVTSDSSNPYKRNFTRRPSLSRLTPYTRYVPAPNDDKPIFDETKYVDIRKTTADNNMQRSKTDSLEDVNIEDLGFFEDLKKEMVDQVNKTAPHKTSQVSRTITNSARMQTTTTVSPSARLDKSINKLERVINGAALLKRAESDAKVDAASYDVEDSPESNVKAVTKSEFIPSGPRSGSISSHVSPCPTGELRCVDGRCITLAQLCDGTIDCSDHADEDNCYT